MDYSVLNFNVFVGKFNRRVRGVFVRFDIIIILRFCFFFFIKVGWKLVFLDYLIKFLRIKVLYLRYFCKLR